MPRATVAMRCYAEDDLIEYADGLAAPGRAEAVEQHIDGCPRCRQLLAELVRADEPASVDRGTLSSPPIVTPDDRVPAEILREYMRADAVHRESIIARVLIGLSAVSIVMLLSFTPLRGTGFLPPALAIQGVMLVYALAVYLALRRGWFHPALPFVAAAVEISMFFAMDLATGLAMGAESIARSPAKPLAGAAIVFMALRGDWRICVQAGVIAAVWRIVVEEIVAAYRPATVDPDAPPGVIIISALFFLLAGAGGAIVARYLVGRAAQALQAIREHDMFGKYVLHEPLGRGGMGQVFRATYCPEGGFVKTVAVKRVRPEIADVPERIAAFRAEAGLAARLAHPNLVQVLDFGRFRGSYMLAMEYVDGVSLARLVRDRGALPPAAVAYLGAEVAAGLAHLHGRRDAGGASLQLVHCDVNPPNVLVSRIGEVKLADFGVARAEVRTAGPRMFSGKPQYAAPEQLRGDPLDGRTDLYGLGLTLYEALTGTPAFASSVDAASRTVRPPTMVRDDIPAELERIVMALLGSDAASRLASADELRERLLALPAAIAPYPTGAVALAAAVRAATNAADRAVGAARDAITRSD